MSELSEMNNDVPAAAAKPKQAGRPRKQKAATSTEGAARPAADTDRAFSPVQLRGEYHRRLGAIADRKEAATGARVTLTGLVEDALRRVYPREFEGADGTSTEAAVGTTRAAKINIPLTAAQVGLLRAHPLVLSVPEPDAESVFNAIITAALCQDSDIASTEAISALEGTVKGSVGQPIAIRDLAFYMRSADPVACPSEGLSDLITAYESGL